MADENRILSAPPGGTGDDMYKIAGAIDPREVSAEALNAGALTDEEFMMAEEFMNALPPKDQGSFLDRLMNDPRATMKSVMDTLGQMFGGMSNDNGSSFDNLVDRTVSGTGTQLKGPLSNSELEMLRQIQSGDERLGALGGIEGSGAMTDAELDAFRKMKMNMDVSPPSGPMTDRELDFIRQQQMDMNVSPSSGAMTDQERAIRRQRMSMDNR